MIAECDRPNAALLTVAAPAVTDNIDDPASILVQPYLNGQAGRWSTSRIISRLVLLCSIGKPGYERQCWWSNPNQTIRIRDTQNPIVTGGAPLVLEATSPNGTVTTPSPSSATDVCDASLSITITPTTAFPLGDTQVTFVATDDSGNQEVTLELYELLIRRLRCSTHRCRTSLFLGMRRLASNLYCRLQRCAIMDIKPQA